MGCASGQQRPHCQFVRPVGQCSDPDVGLRGFGHRHGDRRLHQSRRQQREARGSRGQRARELHGEIREQLDRRAAGGGGEQRLLRRREPDHAADRSGGHDHGHLRQGDLHRERQPDHRQRRQRPPRDQLQSRYGSGAAVPHRRAHRDTRHRRLPGRRGDARGRLRMPLHGEERRHRQLRLPRRHRHPGHRRHGDGGQVHAHAEDPHRHHEAVRDGGEPPATTTAPNAGPRPSPAR